MSTECSKCSTRNRDGAKFCLHCGNRLGAGPPPAAPPSYEATVAKPPARDGSTKAALGGKGTVVPEQQRSPGTVLHSQRQELPVCGWLVIVRGRRKGRDFRIDKEVSVLGREGTCDYVIEDDSVSRQHCRIRREGENFILFDLGSGNGTFLNGEQVQKAELRDGDLFKVGETIVLFKEAKARVSIDQADVRTTAG
ncbi:MAG: FHA domain-containing protein [Acidimicrobiales bacterium]